METRPFESVLNSAAYSLESHAAVRLTSTVIGGRASDIHGSNCLMSSGCMGLPWKRKSASGFSGVPASARDERLKETSTIISDLSGIALSHSLGSAAANDGRGVKVWHWIIHG